MTVKAINFFHGVVFLLFILTISSGVLCGFWRRVQTIACFVFFLLLFSMSFSFVASFFIYFLPFGCRCIFMLVSFFLSFRLGAAFFSCFFLSVWV